MSKKVNKQKQLIVDMEIINDACDDWFTEGNDAGTFRKTVFMACRFNHSEKLFFKHKSDWFYFIRMCIIPELVKAFPTKSLFWIGVLEENLQESYYEEEVQ